MSVFWRIYSIFKCSISSICSIMLRFHFIVLMKSDCIAMFYNLFNRLINKYRNKNYLREENTIFWYYYYYRSITHSTLFNQLRFNMNLVMSSPHILFNYFLSSLFYSISKTINLNENLNQAETMFSPLQTLNKIFDYIVNINDV